MAAGLGGMVRELSGSQADTAMTNRPMNDGTMAKPEGRHASTPMPACWRRTQRRAGPFSPNGTKTMASPRDAAGFAVFAAQANVPDLEGSQGARHATMTAPDRPEVGAADPPCSDAVAPSLVPQHRFAALDPVGEVRPVGAFDHRALDLQGRREKAG